MALAKSLLSHGLISDISPEETSDARTKLQQRALEFLRRPKNKARNSEFQKQKSSEILKLLKEATHLLDRQNVEIDTETYALLLKSCIRANSLPAGQFLHLHILTNGYEGDTYLCNILIEMYGKCGAIDEARYIFDNCLSQRNVYSWTIVIAAYIYHGKHKEARKLFQQMQLNEEKPNEFTFSTVLGTCQTPADAEEGENIHVTAILNGLDTDAVVGTALINMYGKCKSKEDAQVVFEKIQQRDTVAWNAIISVHAQHGDDRKTLELFRQMKESGMKPNAITFASVLGACKIPDHLVQGGVIHAEIVCRGFLFDIVIQNALIDMYGKCGCIASAQTVFHKMHHRNVVTWTSIIAAHAQHPRQALQLFREMLITQLQPNEFTFVSILAACGNLKALEEGHLVHQLIIEVGLSSNIVVATALISMYGRCTTVDSARWVFSHVQARDLVLWNAMIAVYAQHGSGRDALDAFHLMQQGLKPDEITFTSIVHACSLSGLVEEACQIYRSMMKDYNILPSIQHYGCMVDVLGRSSLMEEAEDFIDTMPIIPNVVIWETFVNACRVDRDKKQMRLSMVK